MPLKPSYLLLVGGGAIVAYSGLKGKGVSSALRSVISGQNPKFALSANNIAGTPASGGGGGGGFTHGRAPLVKGPRGPGETAWFTAMLTALGAPATKANLASLHNWRLQESPWDTSAPDGALYAHNPLNTTLATSGSVGQVNSVGVQMYANAAAGIAATVQTLLGGYPHIVADLRKGIGLSTGDPGVAGELSTWSGGGYSSV